MTYTYELSKFVQKLLGGNADTFYDIYNLTLNEVYFHCALITQDNKETDDLIVKFYAKFYSRMGRINSPEEVIDVYNKTLFDVLNDWINRKCISIFVEEENGRYRKPPLLEAYPTENVNTMFTESETANLAATYINLLNPVLAVTALAYYFDSFPNDQIATFLQASEEVVIARTKYAKALIEKKCIEYAKTNHVEIQRVDVRVFLLAFMALFKVTVCNNKDELYSKIVAKING